ncbi:uncharacterized protein [Lolium perenne]|uniref:uncharacterized protein n=1 Tax=Lolium perenne TaxID=4522 RepID=UPI0021F6749A|nr:uncharacterized protein LOC127303973 [Lolium perenne]
MAALLEIWLGRHQGFEDLNEALITLIPKRDGAIDHKDFRPISLVHSFARLLTKVLARRLAPEMLQLVGPHQTAFIRGRCIHDNFLLVKESAKLLHRKRIPSLLLKVDTAKAFDSISWPFLLSVLRQRGFGTRWLGWIKLLLRTASTSVLINGVVGDAFRHGRGLRRGDPISPLLFVIAMEVLPSLFSTAVRAGLLSDLAAVGLRHRISLYTDDVVVFAKPGSRELATIWGGGEVLELSATLPCPISHLPCTYLGLPLSLRKPRKEDLKAVLDKLAAKLPYWKARLMSREGHAVYVQAKTEATKPWAGLNLHVGPDSWALFNASVEVVVGNGRASLFWEDPWLAGLTAGAIAPALMKLVKPAFRKRRSIREGLENNAWVLDIASELSVDATVQYLRLWDAVHAVAIVCDESFGSDVFRWKWSGDGSFSSRSAYRMLFHGTIGLTAAPLIWASFAPLKHRFHAWLALRRRCWLTGGSDGASHPTSCACSATSPTRLSTISPCTAAMRRAYGEG